MEINGPTFLLKGLSLSLLSFLNFFQFSKLNLTHTHENLKLMKKLTSLSLKLMSAQPYHEEIIKHVRCTLCMSRMKVKLN